MLPGYIPLHYGSCQDARIQKYIFGHTEPRPAILKLRGVKRNPGVINANPAKPEASYPEIDHTS